MMKLVSSQSAPGESDPLLNPTTLLVFSDDWGRHPSSCQHLIQRLKGRFRVLWVNTIGMRPPSLGWSTVSRGFEKIKHWSKSQRAAPPATSDSDGITVFNPKMWPWFRRSHDRALNRRLLTSQLRSFLKNQSGPVVGITTIPVVADLMGQLPIHRWVYYCVDDFSKWPGLDQKPLAELEEKVIRSADVLIAASAVLRDRLAQSREIVSLLTHGVDVEHWNLDGIGPHPNLDSLERPIITFWGLVDRRMDVAFIEELSRRLDSGTICLIGPNDQPDPALEQIPRVRLVPALSYHELPQVAQSSDVLVLPYRNAEVTRAMQPLKLLEYLATGKPVVARDLPATRFRSRSLDLATTADEFAAVVTARIQTGTPPEQLLDRRNLESESWDARAEEFEKLIFN